MFPEQIQSNRILQIVYYFVFFTFIITFNDWFNKLFFTGQSVKNFSALCWPHFKECTSLYVFEGIPQGYSLGILYTLLAVFLFTSVFFAFKERWKLALIFLAIPSFFKLFAIFFLSYAPTGNYTVLEALVALLLIFSKRKVFSLKVILTLFYFAAFSIKLHEGYLTGNIFKSLALGVPIFPDFLLPYLGLAFMVVVAVCPILLWVKNRSLRNSSIFILIAFHLYSIILVGYRYPLLCISLLLLAFFLSEYEEFSFRKIITDSALFVVVLLIICLQILPILIKGDVKITLEGQRYGFYMFDANRQCISIKNLYYKDGTTEVLTYENHSGMQRCDPYAEWFSIYSRCKTKALSKITWTFDMSINGSSYYTIVNSDNACLLNYKPFKHNEWIQEGVRNKDIQVYKNSI